MTTIRKRVAIHWARNFAAGMLQNAEPIWIGADAGLTAEEIMVAEEELKRLAAKIQATVNDALLPKAEV
ncbi:hypothetical protein [Chromobacterium haemolyticum]|uniref:hypothetical protein n=1 Tax=Chromobacterium haemolyticum TaxID=394935 RepID=UPI00244D0DE9|nr:hypothetical protein [Chromobacterium haemolyticum]MDH0342120.1 hypothetical protein [Chromobacterium haemolyticum]